MMIKVTNGEITPYSVGRLRRDNPNTSFPKNIVAATLAAYDVYKVVVDPKPDYDERTQKLMPNAIVFDGTNATQAWSVVNLDADELSYKADRVAETNRTTRNKLIAETDWWASSDLTMTVAQTAYRQSLRDITSHANWPHLDEADWPTKP
jgi:hypothetical protein